MEEKVQYNVDGATTITVETEPIVIHEEFVEVVGYGKVKAIFDFSELDPKGHQIALSHIMASSISILMPIPTPAYRYEVVKKPEDLPDNPGLLGKFFNKIFGRKK